MDFLQTILASEEFLGVLSLLLTAFIGVAARQFSAYTGINIQKRHREAFHEALMSGAKSAVAHGPGEAWGTLKAQAIAHAKESVPDAMRSLVPGDGVLDRIAERYVHDAFAQIGEAK